MVFRGFLHDFPSRTLVPSTSAVSPHQTSASKLYAPPPWPQQARNGRSNPETLHPPHLINSVEKENSA
ncbi:hypothetical protein BHM03_00005734 [Ensete ventricosum]|nr:hypothetical protein BHM03_00005734 [Ensete ventricosum]